MYFVTNFLSGVSKRIGSNTIILSNSEISDFKIYTESNFYKSAHITAYTYATDHDTIFMLRNFTRENIKISNFDEPTINVNDGWKIQVKAGDIIILNDDSQFVIVQLTPPNNRSG